MERRFCRYWTQIALTFQHTDDAKIYAKRIGLRGDGNTDIYGFELLHAIRRAANLSVMTMLEKLP